MSSGGDPICMVYNGDQARMECAGDPECVTGMESCANCGGDAMEKGLMGDDSTEEARLEPPDSDLDPFRDELLDCEGDPLCEFCEGDEICIACDGDPECSESLEPEPEPESEPELEQESDDQ